MSGASFLLDSKSRRTGGGMLGLDASDSGPVSFGRNFMDLMTRYGIEPKDGESWKARIDQGRRNLTHLDLREQYNNSYVELDMRRHIGSDKMNSMNNWLYLSICPIRLTNQMNFTWSTMDIFQAPFDRMSPLNVARTTGYKRETHQATLDFYKRAIEIEGTLLNDPEFGPQAMDICLQGLNSHCELTLMMVVVRALVDIPYNNLLLKGQNPSFGFNHLRQAMFEEEIVFLGAKNPALLMNRIYKMVNDRNQIDTIIGSTNAGARFAVTAATQRSIIKWAPVYDTNTNRLMIAEFESSDVTSRSFPMTNGRSLEWFDLQPFSGYPDEPIDDDAQPLRGRLTLGEVIISPPPHLEDLEAPLATTVAKMLDCIAPVQTPSRISYKRYSYRDQLKVNILFTNPDTGILNYAPDGGLSPLMTELAADYNKAGVKEKFRTAMRDPEHFSNDVASSRYISAVDTKLASMTGFRHFYPFLYLNDISGNIEPARYVGDVEPKSLPAGLVLREAHHLANVAAKKMIGTTAEIAPGSPDYERLFLVQLKKLLPNSALFAPAVVDGAGAFVSGGFDPAWNGAATKAMAESLRTTGTDAGAEGESADRVAARPGAARTAPIPLVPQFLRAPVAYSLPATSLLVPRVGESKGDYIARFTGGETPIGDIVDEAHLDAKNSAWAHLLQHVPDEALTSFLGLVHAVHANGRAATDADAEALNRLVSTEIQHRSTKAHVTTILKAALVAAEAATSQNGIADALNARLVKPMLNTNAEAKANGQAMPTAAIGKAVSAHIGRQFASSTVGSISHATSTGGAVARAIVLPRSGETDARFSWRHFQEFIDNEKALLDISVFLAYVAILNCPFNFYTCDLLARHGLPLIQQETYRLFIDQSADAIVLLKRGYDTFFLAAGHGIVTSGISAAENSFTLHAQMHLGVIQQSGAKDIVLLPYVLPAEHHGGRIGEPIRTRADLLLPDARDRPSDITVATAVNELRHEFPISPLRDELYRAPDIRTNLPTRKSSATDLLIKFFGPDWFANGSVLNSIFAQFYQYPMEFATHIHLAPTFRPISNDPNSREWRSVDGTGPLGDHHVSCPAAASVMNGGGAGFPESYEAVLVW